MGKGAALCRFQQYSSFDLWVCMLIGYGKGHTSEAHTWPYMICWSVFAHLPAAALTVSMCPAVFQGRRMERR